MADERWPDKRWEDDPDGAGVSDGDAFAPPILALLEEMARPDWNTEQPEAHLLPHLERHLAGDEGLRLIGARDEDGVFVVELRSETASGPEVRPLVYALISTIAEPTTVVVERENATVFDVTLAVTPGQGPFPKGHGHLVRFLVAATI